ncbi:isoleucine--tRNA ligase, putative [Plasmodium malariae]|uniref:isoleucine--tRNA ligase n=1 Tax=Plasmodium malariae TaxID=5858 RepID=A0A1A8WRJ6_PLAMA|nr:isoleucine--tRNA ligase, putative [Plasmodium malariae]SBS95527.1 isoleucine--tRNA ligase, putative [Plasmodium malariae]SCO93722.1 isoleucine--tRNA ligase, putative [Plasmodium malariae]
MFLRKINHKKLKVDKIVARSGNILSAKKRLTRNISQVRSITHVRNICYISVISHREEKGFRGKKKRGQGSIAPVLVIAPIGTIARIATTVPIGNIAPIATALFAAPVAAFLNPEKRDQRDSMTALTFECVSESPNIVEEEEKILKYWKEIDAFNLSNKLSQNKKPYIFYDGPPFATGLPHYGHLLAGIIKDCVTRYNYQCNYYVERRFGWDCHGLPIEYEIEKENNINKKEDIIKMGIDVYNEKCRNIVLKYSNEWIKTVERIGRWIDFKNDYKTMDTTFMESVWWVFSELYKRGFIYKSFKVMPYSCKCNTPISNFELNLNYKDTPDPSVIIGFILSSSFPHVEEDYSKDEDKQELLQKYAIFYDPYFNAHARGGSTAPGAATAADTAFNTNNCSEKREPSAGTHVNNVDNVPSFSGEGLPNEVLAWTTTPWTLPSNLALCVNENFTYLRIQNRECKRIMIVGECRLDWIIKELKINPENICILNRFKGKYLKNLKYKPLFNEFYERYNFKERAYKILADDFVTDDVGTGIVHCAPSYGEDDFRICKDNEIIDPEKSILVDPLDENGFFTEEIELVKNMYLKDADNIIKKYLKEQNRLLSNNTIVHSYPFCWRSDTPLIYRAIPAWFVRVSSVSKNLLKNNDVTYWIPAHVKEKKFHNWIKDAKDWCISRNRYWGTPLPLWCDEKMETIICIGSIKQLEELSGVKNITDLHRHHIDKIEIDNPKGKHLPKLKRIAEVFDCWFESGSMPFAKVHYPFSTKKESLEKIFPADFIAEGLDQTRGWFYTLLVVSTLLFDKAPYKNLICNGLVLASDGKKMSKRLKNYPDPVYILNKYGADSLRLYLINSVAVRAENLKFQEKGVNEIVKSFILPFYHSFRFFAQEVTRFESRANGSTSGTDDGIGTMCCTKFVFSEQCIYQNDNIMDQWIFSCIQNLIRCVHEEMRAYKLYNVLPKLLHFIENLTNWYIRLNRDRMRGSLGQKNCLQALNTTYKTLYLFTIIMAPFTPFISEYIYQQLRNVHGGKHQQELDQTKQVQSNHTQDAKGRSTPSLVNNTCRDVHCNEVSGFDNKKDVSNISCTEEMDRSKSVHFMMLPKVDEHYTINYEIIELIENMKNVIIMGRILREKRKTANKKPLKLLTIVHKDSKFFNNFDKITHYIKEELNVLNVDYSNDVSCLTFTAVPNFKKLGTKLGANLKSIQNKIKDMTVEEIKKYEQERKILIDQVLLQDDDILIQMKHNLQDINIEAMSNDSITILMDFTADAQLEDMANAREICNHIQKIRKNLSLIQNSPIQMHIFISDEEFKKSMIKEIEYIKKCLRRNLNLFSTMEDVEHVKNKFHEEHIKVNHKDVTVVFTKE